MLKMSNRTQALALYQRATETNLGWREAAEALAAMLPKPKAAPSLATPVKTGKRPKAWGAFLVSWADGSATRVVGVGYDRMADREPAAFQAADRLRRARMRHGWEGESGAPARWTRGMMGTRIESAAWWSYVKARELPPVARIEALDA
jgi:hypothetical protein